MQLIEIELFLRVLPLFASKTPSRVLFETSICYDASAVSERNGTIRGVRRWANCAEWRQAPQFAGRIPAEDAISGIEAFGTGRAVLPNTA